MATDGRSAPAVVRYRAHLWLAVGFFFMAPLFGLMAFGGTLVDPAVDVNCRRQQAVVGCDVVTAGLFQDSVVALADADLRGARIVLVREPHDPSFKKAELRRNESVRLLADFTDDAHPPAVADVNHFLSNTSSSQVSARIVGPPRTPWQRFGLFPFQLIALLCLACGFYSALRRTTLAAIAGDLEVRRTRWPRPAVVERWPLQQIAGVEVVARIPKDLAPIVARLPWRNIYRLTAVAIRTTAGEEVVISDWSKRSRTLHERLAATIGGWLPPGREQAASDGQGAISNRSS
jgi:hypothetical protein